MDGFFMPHFLNYILLLLVIIFLTLTKALSTDSTRVSPYDPHNMQLDCSLTWGSASDQTSIKAWDTSYMNIDNGESPCPSGSVMTSLHNNVRTSGGGGRVYNNLYVTCTPVSVTCTWG